MTDSMKNGHSEGAVVQEFIRRVLEKEEIGQITAMLDEQVEWIEAGIPAVYHGREEIERYLTDRFMQQKMQYFIIINKVESFHRSNGLTLAYGYIDYAEADIRDSGRRMEYGINCRPGQSGPLICSIQTAEYADPKRLMEQKQELRLSEKRCEIAMRLTDVTMFEYNIINGDLILYNETARMYLVPEVIPDGMNTFIKRGIIEPESVPDYRQMYQRIHAGEPVAKCFVKARDANGDLHDFELILTSIYDENNRPVRAVGVRRNVSQILTLQRENEFGRNFVQDKTFIFEADITNDRLEYLNEKWKELLGAAAGNSYQTVLVQLADIMVAHEQRLFFLSKLSAEHIREMYAKGGTLIDVDYKGLDSEGNYIWYRGVINIIRDNLTGSLNIRYYRSDIDDLKKAEHKAIEERQLYEAVVAGSHLAYEVNITQNRVIHGIEEWEKQYGIRTSENYTDMVMKYSSAGIHPKDGHIFFNALRRENVMERFTAGDRQIGCQYRKLYENGDYRWVDCVLHMYSDPETGDIKGHCYAEDIDTRKKEELTLKYQAEHDLLTRLYNKSTSEQKIHDFMQSPEGIRGMHAFMMIDIDYFKYVNDNFGHFYGDGVISEIAGKIRDVFRTSDIIGRVGGDEFCVLMKNVKSDRIAQMKAEELCTSIRHVYTRENRSCTVTASVGIALYTRHGKSYEELFKHADERLYEAKRSGRNQYCI